MELEQKIESLLFHKSEPVSVVWLAKNLGAEEGEVWCALKTLREALLKRGVRLLEKDAMVALGTAPEASKLIEQVTKEDLERDIGTASIETLTIIAYRGPISKSEIDYIRGVNSSFILRNLLVRGLIERTSSPDDKRIFLYRPSMDFLTYIGLTRKEDLPEYEEVAKEILAFEEEFKKEAE